MTVVDPTIGIGLGPHAASANGELAVLGARVGGGRASKQGCRYGNPQQGSVHFYVPHVLLSPSVRGGDTTPCTGKKVETAITCQSNANFVASKQQL
jgi:hypothetical protein